MGSKITLLPSMKGDVSSSMIWELLFLGLLRSQPLRQLEFSPVDGRYYRRAMQDYSIRESLHKDRNISVAS